MKKKAQIITSILCLLSIVVLFSGCSKAPQTPAPSDKTPQTSEQDTLITKNITLYFSDDQAMYLVPETREVKIPKDSDAAKVGEAIVKELIVGPADNKLGATFPKEAKLLSLKITDQTAYVDFSEEIRSKHPGGSTGEAMTLNSLVNSLTELKEIQKVKILINGKEVDTLVGHADLTQPLTRNESIIKK